MANTAAVFDVHRALIVRIRLALPDVRVAHGVLLGDEALTEKIEIGVDNPDSVRAGARSASSDLTWAHLGNRARDESFRIRCMASARVGESGDDGAALAMANAETLVDAVQADLWTDPTVNATCLYARVADLEISQGQNRGGSVCQVAFTIEGRARLTA